MCGLGYGPVIYPCWRWIIRGGKHKQWRLGFLSLFFLPLQRVLYMTLRINHPKILLPSITPLVKHLQLSLLSTTSRVNKLCPTSSPQESSLHFLSSLIFNQPVACPVASTLSNPSPCSALHLPNPFLLQNLDVFSSPYFSKSQLLQGQLKALLSLWSSNSSSPCQCLLMKF